VTGPPFAMTRSIPQGSPIVVPPAPSITTKEYFRQFTGDKMKEAMIAEGFNADMRRALNQTMSFGSTPKGPALDDRIPMGKLGKRYNIGTSSLAEMCVIEVREKADMFSVSQEAKETGYHPLFFI